MSTDTAMTQAEILADWLAEMMDARQLSQAELARRAGLSRASISNYMGAKIARPDEVALRGIAHALNLPVEAVYRAAGLLPAIPQGEKPLESIRAVLDLLTADEVETLRRFALVMIQMRMSQPPR